MARPTKAQSQFDKLSNMIMEELARRNDLSDISTSDLLKLYEKVSKASQQTSAKKYREVLDKAADIEGLISSYANGIPVDQSP